VDGQEDMSPLFASAKPPKMEENKKAARDFGFNDKSKEELYELGIVIGDMANKYDENSYLINGPQQVEHNMETLATLFASGDPQMMTVANDMFDHFINGNGANYRNPVLTQKAIEHPSTQNFTTKTMDTVKKYLDLHGGDLEALETDVLFLGDMEDIHGPIFNTDSDLVNGLTICVNDTWGYYVDIADYNFDGKSYSGTIKYTVYDHFGLDAADISEANWFKGATAQFAAWYVLQHYKECNGKYKPFVTYIEFEVPFSGTID